METNEKYARDYQLTTAAAVTSDKARKYLLEALSCVKPKFLQPGSLVKDPRTGETRTKELTPLMIACIMGQKN